MTNTQDRTERLRSALMEAGAYLVGFADLSCLDANVTKRYSFGISFALQYDLDVVDSLPHAELFLTMKAEIEEKAKKLYAITTELLNSWGYRYTRIFSGLRKHVLPSKDKEKSLQDYIPFFVGIPPGMNADFISEINQQSEKDDQTIIGKGNVPFAVFRITPLGFEKRLPNTKEFGLNEKFINASNDERLEDEKPR